VSETLKHAAKAHERKISQRVPSRPCRALDAGSAVLLSLACNAIWLHRLAMCSGAYATCWRDGSTFALGTASRFTWRQASVERFLIDHGWVWVIGETAEIGDESSSLYQGRHARGTTSWDKGKPSPHGWKTAVVVGARGQRCCGPAFTVGAGAKIGPSTAVVTKSGAAAVPTAVGIPWPHHSQGTRSCR